MTTRRRRVPFWVLFAAFVLVPLAEIYVLIQVGQVIGAWWTIVLLVVDSLVGGWLVRREGGRAWRALSTALSSGRMPATEIADGVLVLVGGVLMLTPGFVTDAAGILMILPMTRPLFRRALAGAVGRRLFSGPFGATSPGPDARRPGPGSGDGSVVQGEVVDDE